MKHDVPKNPSFTVNFSKMSFKGENYDFGVPPTEYQSSNLELKKTFLGHKTNYGALLIMKTHSFNRQSYYYNAFTSFLFYF
jgi:hypothetical protein